MTPAAYIERNQSVDVLRFICACLVVTIHCTFYGKEWIMPISRCAVPLFFMMSGYFIFNENSDKMGNRLKKGIIKLLKITFYSFLFYFFLYYLPYCVFRGITIWDSSMIWKVLVFNVDPIFSHLWYLLAALYALVLIWTINHVLGWKHLLAFAIIPIIATIAINYTAVSCTGHFVPSYFYRNFLLEALPYFCLGALIKRNRDRIIQKSSHVYLLLALITLALCYAENVWCVAHQFAPDLFIFTAPLCCAVFAFTLKHNVKPCILSRLGKDYSLYIYILHAYFIFLIGFYFRNRPFPGYFYWSPIAILIITISVIAVMKGIAKIGKKIFHRL